jgi:hypothetical protein
VARPLGEIDPALQQSLLESSERISAVYRAVAESVRSLPTRVEIDYPVLYGRIEEARESAPNPTLLDQIKADVDALKAQAEAQTRALTAVAEVGDVGNVELTRLVNELKLADKKSKGQFWWGLALAIPIGLIGSVLAWAIGIS